MPPVVQEGPESLTQVGMVHPVLRPYRHRHHQVLLQVPELAEVHDHTVRALLEHPVPGVPAPGAAPREPEGDDGPPPGETREAGEGLLHGEAQLGQVLEHAVSGTRARHCMRTTSSCGAAISVWQIQSQGAALARDLVLKEESRRSLTQLGVDDATLGVYRVDVFSGARLLQELHTRPLLFPSV